MNGDHNDHIQARALIAANNDRNERLAALMENRSLYSPLADSPQIRTRQQVFRAYPSSRWEHTYYDEQTDGCVVTAHKRKPEGIEAFIRHQLQYGKTLRELEGHNDYGKFIKEQTMAKDLAHMGKYTVHLRETPTDKPKDAPKEMKSKRKRERPRKDSYDILLNGVPAEFKAVDGWSNIVSYSRHAFNDPKARIVVFRIGKGCNRTKAAEKLREACRETRTDERKKISNWKESKRKKHALKRAKGAKILYYYEG